MMAGLLNLANLREKDQQCSRATTTGFELATPGIANAVPRKGVRKQRENGAKTRFRHASETAQAVSRAESRDGEWTFGATKSYHRGEDGVLHLSSVRTEAAMRVVLAIALALVLGGCGFPTNGDAPASQSTATETTSPPRPTPSAAPQTHSFANQVFTGAMACDITITDGDTKTTDTEETFYSVLFDGDGVPTADDGRPVKSGYTSSLAIGGFSGTGTAETVLQTQNGVSVHWDMSLNVPDSKGGYRVFDGRLTDTYVDIGGGEIRYTTALALANMAGSTMTVIREDCIGILSSGNPPPNQTSPTPQPTPAPTPEPYTLSNSDTSANASSLPECGGSGRHSRRKRNRIKLLWRLRDCQRFRHAVRTVPGQSGCYRV